MAPRVTAANTKQASDDNLASNDLIARAAPAQPSSSTTRKRAAPTTDSSSTATASTGTPEESIETIAPKKAKAPAHQVLTDRDEIPKLWNEQKAKANGSYTFKIASWNVAGIRALLKREPNVFAKLVAKHNLDVLCLQETKLQEQHLDDPKLKIRDSVLSEAAASYDGYWSCSTAKKGYAGTAVFVRNHRKGKATTKQTTMDSFVGKGTKSKSKPETDKPLSIDPRLLIPEKVSYTMGIDKHDQEGRMVVVEMPLFTFCNVYVPNSGQKLERLSYRTDEWDRDFLAFMQSKQKRDRPVLWLGDLNVAHTHLEVWNDGAKHLAKQAGVTAEERASFQAQLETGFIDAFRHLHPTAAGHYSYWSTRAGNRKPNKGLRLDYFVCDPALFEESSPVVVRDSYMDHEQLGSDHCPVILELEIKAGGSTS